MSDLPPANWYPDPEVPGQQRYWDGTQWTEHRAPGAGAATSPGSEQTTGYPQQDQTGGHPQYAPQAPGQPQYGQQQYGQQQYGQQYAPQGGPGYGQQSSPATNGMAIAALVLSIVWLGGLGSLAAVVLGIVAIRQINASNGAQGGKGLAITGTVIGGIGIVGSFLFWALVFSVSSGTSTFFEEVIDYAECVEQAERTGQSAEDC